jgi:hypothetical protein
MGDCGGAPTDETKIDWFLETVNEPTYEAVNSHCVLLQQEGTLAHLRLPSNGQTIHKQVFLEVPTISHQSFRWQ